MVVGVVSSITTISMGAGNDDVSAGVSIDVMIGASVTSSFDMSLDLLLVVSVTVASTTTVSTDLVAVGDVMVVEVDVISTSAEMC